MDLDMPESLEGVKAARETLTDEHALDADQTNMPTDDSSLQGKVDVDSQHKRGVSFGQAFHEDGMATEPGWGNVHLSEDDDTGFSSGTHAGSTPIKMAPRPAHRSVSVSFDYGHHFDIPERRPMAAYSSSVDRNFYQRQARQVRRRSSLSMSGIASYQNQLQDMYDALSCRAHDGTATREEVREELGRLFNPDLLDRIFDVVDEGHTGRVDVRKFMCGLSSCCGGSTIEKLRFCFHISYPFMKFNREQMEAVLLDFYRVVEIHPNLRKDFKTINDQVSHDSVTYQRRTSMSYTLAPDKETRKTKDKCREPLTANVSYAEISRLVGTFFDQMDTQGTNELSFTVFSHWLRLNSKRLASFMDRIAQFAPTTLLEPPLRRSDEREIIQQLMARTPATPESDALQLRYLIDANWWNEWKKYVNYDNQEEDALGLARHKPSVIDNKPLLEEDEFIGEEDHCTLRQFLDEDVDFVAVTKEVWDTLKGFRMEQGTTAGLRRIVRSKTETVEAVEVAAQEELDLEDDQTRLWRWDGTESDIPKLLPKQADETLEDVGLTDRNYLIVDVKNSEDAWGMEVLFAEASLAPNVDVGYRGSGLIGLRNLGNTCYMNSALQCMLHTIPLRDFFLTDLYTTDINKTNPLGMGGEVALAYANLLKEIWSTRAMGSVAPRDFKSTLSRFAPQFQGYQQQDAQELVVFLLDGLHEDMNRVLKKPYIEAKDSEGRTDQDVATEAWDIHMKRNRSIIVSLFQGQAKSTIICKTCQRKSVTFQPYTFMSLPVPASEKRLLPMHVVDRQGETWECQVVVPSDGTMQDVLDAVHELDGLQINKEKCILAEMANESHNLSGVHSNTDKLSYLSNRFTQMLYDYVDPPIDYTGVETSVVMVLHRKMPVSQGDDIYQMYGKPQPFGMPVAVEVPKEVSPADLRAIVWNRVRMTVDMGGHPYADEDMVLTWSNRNGTGCGKCGWSSQCTGCPVAPPKPAVKILVNPPSSQPVDENEAMETGKSEEGNDGGDVEDGQFDDAKEDLDSNDGQNEKKEDETKEEEIKEVGESSDGEMKDAEETNEEGKKETENIWGDFETGPTEVASIDEMIEEREEYVTIPDHCTIAMDWTPRPPEYGEDPTSVCEGPTPLPPKKHPSLQTTISPVSLKDCLDKFSSVEEMTQDDGVYCSSCKEFRPSTKQMQLWSAPPVLIVHFNRFEFNPQTMITRKLGTTIEFPPALDLSPYLLEHDNLRASGIVPPPAEYDLYGVTHHLGARAGSGHYIAYVYHTDKNTWYCYDDSACNEASFEESHTGAAYLLFYMRRGVTLADVLPTLLTATSGLLEKPSGGRAGLSPRVQRLAADSSKKTSAMSDSDPN